MVAADVPQPGDDHLAAGPELAEQLVELCHDDGMPKTLSIMILLGSMAVTVSACSASQVLLAYGHPGGGRDVGRT